MGINRHEIPARSKKLSLMSVIGSALVVSALLTTSACTSNSDQGATTSAASSATDTDRKAASANGKLRVCVQNRSGAELRLEWNSSIQTDQRVKTLAPDASDCAVSFSTLGTQYAKLTVAGHRLDFYNDDVFGGIKMSTDRVTEKLTPSNIKSVTLTGSGKPSLLVEAVSTELLTTFNDVEAYPIDVQIYSN